MRRAPIVITATLLGTAGVLLFKPLSPSSVADTAQPTGGASGSGASSTAEPAASPSPSTSSGGAASASGTGSSGAKNGTWTGAAETTRFGTTQVRVVIRSGRISEVTAVQLNQDDPRSVQISQSAAPVLRSEVLAAQKAAVDTVSGATYTSDAYEASLQSALDEAGFAAADGSKASTDLSNVESGGFGH